MNFAILFDKPIFFLTLDNYRKTHDYFRPNFLSQHFKTFCFDIDREFDFPKKNRLFNANKSVYKKYKKDYLVTSNYDDSKLWNSFPFFFLNHSSEFNKTTTLPCLEASLINFIWP